jgi:hypothetical protein
MLKSHIRTLLRPNLWGKKENDQTAWTPKTLGPDITTGSSGWMALDYHPLRMGEFWVNLKLDVR